MQECNIHRPTLIKIYDAVIANYSGSIMLNIKADDGTIATINLATQNLRFASGSGAHGFGFRVSGNNLYLETPQPLTSGSNVIFSSLQTSGSIKAEKFIQKNKFMLVNSGSSTGDGGIIIRSGSNFSGTAFGWDDASKRFGVQVNTKLHHTASGLTPEAYIANVIDIDGGQTEKTLLQKVGNLKISGSLAYIYI